MFTKARTPLHQLNSVREGLLFPKEAENVRVSVGIRVRGKVKTKKGKAELSLEI